MKISKTIVLILIVIQLAGCVQPFNRIEKNKLMSREINAALASKSTLPSKQGTKQAVEVAIEELDNYFGLQVEPEADCDSRVVFKSPIYPIDGLDEEELFKLQLKEENSIFRNGYYVVSIFNYDNNYVGRFIVDITGMDVLKAEVYFYDLQDSLCSRETAEIIAREYAGKYFGMKECILTLADDPYYSWPFWVQDSEGNTIMLNVEGDSGRVTSFSKGGVAEAEKEFNIWL